MVNTATGTNRFPKDRRWTVYEKALEKAEPTHRKGQTVPRHLV